MVRVYVFLEQKFISELEMYLTYFFNIFKNKFYI